MLDKGKTPYFYYNNHLGAPVKLTDKEGTVVWSATYTAFGKAEITLAKVTNNLRLPGQYFDKETGLHYNFQRYYDAETGRYITADPIGLAGGINVYAYVGGNPVSFGDPWGLLTWGGWNSIEDGLGRFRQSMFESHISYGKTNYTYSNVNVHYKWNEKTCTCVKTWDIVETSNTDVFQYHSFVRQNQWHTTAQATVWYTAKMYSYLSTYYGAIESAYLYKARRFAAGTANSIGTIITYFALPEVIQYLEDISYNNDSFGLNTLEYYETDPVKLRTDTLDIGRYQQRKRLNISKENCRNK